MPEPFPLDSPRWATLTHAYGSASSSDPHKDIPTLIRQLQTLSPVGLDVPNAEPMFSLWSALCHQDDVYPASYAALPHLVRIVATAPVPVAARALQLTVGIAIGQHTDGAPAIPFDLVSAYRHSVDVELPAAIKRFLDGPWDEFATVGFLAAAAVSKGRIRVAEAMFDLVVCTCPHCGELSPLSEMLGDNTD